ncbi:hypothetical protein DFH08DRAFT_973585 [Mycena albidolilacea]|uniref:Uncharacterized protein n=1 Tax=Mycena albidolilacea TaxID=1033008 RepID=A0AAD6Z9H3_9AGAR|nr:hypothetical protein DFH08DRAFT_973585 [Mycena albidolilacea]
MLRNSSDTFISQSTSRKFLDTLEDLLAHLPRHARTRNGRARGGRVCRWSLKDAGLWRHVKPRDKPEDTMFNPRSS